MIKFIGVYKALQWLKRDRKSPNSNKVQPSPGPYNEEHNDTVQIFSGTPRQLRIINVQSNNDIEPTQNGSKNMRRRNLSRQISKTKKKSLRLEKVISGIHDFESIKMDEIKEDIKLQSKSLMKFLAAFILYAVLGGLVFFYIEECSDWGNAGDSSVPQIGDRYIEATYKNVTLTCFELFKNATNQSSLKLATGHFDSFLSVCRTLLKEGVNPFVKEGHKQHCVWDEFQLLKYAEYTIFTLLTIGKFALYIG